MYPASVVPNVGRRSGSVRAGATFLSLPNALTMCLLELGSSEVKRRPSRRRPISEMRQGEGRGRGESAS